MSNTQTPPDESELTNPTDLGADDAAPEGAREPEVDGATRAAFESDLKRTERSLKSQKRVTVKVQEDTYVAINGYGFLIQGKTKVAVPEQVAEILEEAGRI